MNTIEVLVVRIYLTESSHLLNKIVSYLKNDIKIRGVSVFRAISGYGEAGNHTSSLVELSLDLPLTIEFFDVEDKVKSSLQHLTSIIKPEHIIFWHAKTNG